MCELLRKPETNVNVRSVDGHTPLMVACSYGHLKAATALIDFSANLALFDNAGRSALAHANTRAARAGLTEGERKGAKAIVVLLEAYGA